MGIIEVILSIISYSLGIATLIVQIICYLKKMEYMITILFILSFLFLIASISVGELNLFLNNKDSILMDGLITFSTLCLALTTPINVHKERIVKFESRVNKFFFFATAILFILMVTGYIMGFNEAVDYIIRYFMFGSVAYSMIIILTKKPTMLVKHCDKIERTISIIFFSILPVFIFIDLFYDRLPFILSFIPEGSYLLFMFFIFIASNKLFDDIKRLTLFTPNNSINQRILARYEITPRETEVLMQIVKGKSYNDIAETLFISMPTVKTHISRAYKKMNINNKIELINLLNTSQNQNVIDN